MITIIWFMVTLLLIVIEIVTVNISSIWFVIGSLCALILSVKKYAFYIQFLSFIIIGLLLYIFVRPIVEEKIFNLKLKKVNKEIINKRGKVCRNVLPDKGGEVKVAGRRWYAKASELIKKGEEIKVKSIENFSLVIERDKKKRK